MEKNRFKYVFVVLVYRNMKDIRDFVLDIKSHNLDSKIIIVNSYYDDETKAECEKTAEDAGCVFLNVENRGYGYGNNRGIEYALKNFKFDFLIVSNPDIVIKKFSDDSFSSFKDAVIGPVIRTLTNKSQNPYWVYENPLSEYLIYKGYKNKSKLLLYAGIGINKVIREAFLACFGILRLHFKRVFALHGSFVIFSHGVFDKIKLPYDEDMFLFAEEANLAHLLKKNKIKSYLSSDVEILHKEDGSIGVSKIDEKSEARKSIITYYEKLR